MTSYPIRLPQRRLRLPRQMRQQAQARSLRYSRRYRHTVGCTKEHALLQTMGPWIAPILSAIGMRHPTFTTKTLYQSATVTIYAVMHAGDGGRQDHAYTQKARLGAVLLRSHQQCTVLDCTPFEGRCKKPGSNAYAAGLIPSINRL